VNFSPNVSALKPSATLALAARAKELKRSGIPVVDLSAGEPAYGTPPYAADAGIQAIRDGHTGYPPTPGTLSLREAIASYLVETTGASEVDPAGVLVSAGVKQALFNCAYVLFGSGDEVLIPSPYWPSYPSIVELAGARPVIVETTWEEGFVPTPASLEAARTENTRGLMINSPSNPTGAVYDQDQFGAIANWCDEHGIWLFSDEIYRRMSYECSAPSTYDLGAAPERMVLFDGVSKAFCMPGWRIGFAVGPAEVMKKAADLQSQTTSGAMHPAQHAAAAALGQSAVREEWIGTLVHRLAGLRAQGLELLSDVAGVEVFPPDGAIYFFVKLTDAKAPANSLEVAEQLLQEAQVASIPGEPLGSPGYLRFNFAVEEDVLEEGLTRVREFFSR
jgi:aspartate aminotransferase